MLSSLAHARQSWRYARGVFVLAAAALAVGIGATTAIYTVVNAVMLRPLAYPHGDRFGQLFGASIGDANARSSLSFDDAVAYQAQTASFDVFGWFRPETYTLTAPGRHSTCRVRPSRRRSCRASASSPRSVAGSRSETTSVISDGLWKRLGGGPLLGAASC